MRRGGKRRGPKKATVGRFWALGISQPDSSPLSDAQSPNVVPSVSRNDVLANFIFVYTLACSKKRRYCESGKICVSA